jgi:hypothetical protein
MIGQTFNVPSLPLARFERPSNLPSLITIYVRKEVDIAWKQIDSIMSSKDQNKAILVGVPGSGKSVLAWAWAVKSSQTKRVIWLHLNDNSSQFHLTTLSSGVITSYEFVEPSVLSAWVGLEEYLSDNSDVVIFDGYNKFIQSAQYLYERLACWTSNGLGLRKYLICSSHQIDIPKFSSSGYVVSKMACWTYADFEAALAQPLIWQQVKPVLLSDVDIAEEDMDEADPETKTVLLERKFYYAGFSARWMFDITVCAIISETKLYHEKISDLDKFFKGATEEATEDAMNHLQVSIQNASVPISSYFTDLLRETFHTQFFAQLQQLSSKEENEVFDGWILDLDFKVRIQSLVGRSISLFTNDDGQWSSSVSYKVGGVTSYAKIDEIQVKPPLNTWLIPRRFNHPCFDLLVEINVGVWLVVQITRSDHHDVRLKYLVHLIIEFHLPHALGHDGLSSQVQRV